MEPRALPFVTGAEDGWYLNVRVQPGAKKSELCGMAGGALRVRLAAPAVENKANLALLDFMAKALGLKKNKVILAGGEKSRQKRLFIPAGAAPEWAALMTADSPDGSK